MATMMAKAKRQNERGMALLLALFALLLLSAIGLFMVMASDTETRIDANYGSTLRSYYAARSGLEEIRDRIKYPASSSSGGEGLSDQLPQTFPGSANSVLYVVSDATIDPTDPTSPYFDDQLCHDYDSGVDKDTKCTTLPGTPNWNLHARLAATGSPQQPPSYKWVRINLKTNVGPYSVDPTAPKNTLVCWDGQSEQLSPGGANPSCDANGMQSVYMLTSLAVTSQAGSASGSRKLLRFEVAAPSIRPPGTVTMGASGTLPVLVSTGGGIPSLAIDGRPRKLDGVTLATSSSCSSVAPLGTDTATGSAQLEQALNLVRKNIVDSANASCKMDGTGLNGNICSPGAWWVRGTDTDPRFITSNSGTSNSGSTGTSGTSGSSGSDDRRGRDGDDDGHDGHDHHNDPSGVADSSGACDPTNPSCFTNLDLAAPELFATSAVTGTHIPVVTLPVDGIAPFTGGRGNQSDASIYQPGSTRIVNNAISAVNELVHTSIDQPNYFTVSSAALAPTYGSSTNPAVVVITDSTLSLQNTSVGLTGYGVLVIPQALEISNAPFHWTGIVVVQSPTGHVTINSGATGSINGALLLQPGAALNLQNDSGGFRLTYSCEAIDLPFASSPFRIISTAETSF